jgi:hypothetical protein
MTEPIQNRSIRMIFSALFLVLLLAALDQTTGRPLIRAISRSLSLISGRPLLLVTVCAGSICWIALAEVLASATGQHVEAMRANMMIAQRCMRRSPRSPTLQDIQQTCRESVGA